MVASRANDDAVFLANQIQQADFLRVVKSNNLTALKNLVAHTNNSLFAKMISTYVDSNQKCALDYAIENNNVELFNYMLQVLYQYAPDKFAHHLAQFSKRKKGVTPWHIAAQEGYEDFFKAPDRTDSDSDQLLIWATLKEIWLNARDGEGNTPLHLAMKYHPKASHERIKAKKHVVKALTQLDELDLSIVNTQSQTALHVATNLGCYETIKILLLSIYKKNKLSTGNENSVIAKSSKADIDQIDEKKVAKESKETKSKEKKSKKENKESSTLKITKKGFLNRADANGYTAVRMAAELGRQRAFNAITYFQNQKPPKQKSDGSSVELESLKAWAVDINFPQEDFMKYVKLATYLTYEEVMHLINLRVEAAEKRYKKIVRNSVIFGSLCPAITAATFLGTFGGLNPEPLTATIITAAAFPVIYIPFVYGCYKMRMREYSNTTKEAMRFNWLATKLPLYELEFANELTQINAEAVEVNNRLVELKLEKNSKEFANLQSQYEQLSKRHEDVKKKMNSLLEFTEDGRSKLALSFIPRAELKNKKALGVSDPKENSAWINKKESMSAFIAYNTDIFCPLGAGLNIAAVATSLIIGKFGLSFLGLGAASSVFGPVGPLVVGVIATTVLGIAIAAAIYKASYDTERRNMGAQNRALVQSYDSCQMRSNMTALQMQNQQVKTQLIEAGTQLNNAEQILKKVEATGKLTQNLNKKKTKQSKISNGTQAKRGKTFESLEIETSSPIKKCSFWQFWQRLFKPAKKKDDSILLDFTPPGTPVARHN